MPKFSIQRSLMMPILIMVRNSNKRTDKIEQIQLHCHFEDNENMN